MAGEPETRVRRRRCGTTVQLAAVLSVLAVTLAGLGLGSADAAHSRRDGRCPVSIPHAPGNSVEGQVIGARPVFASADVGNRYPIQPPVSSAAGQWGYFKVLWSVRGYRRAIRISGHQIGGPHQLRFGNVEKPPVSGFRIASGDSGTPAPSGPSDPWRFFPSEARVSAPGCYRLQIDGPSLKESLVIRAVR